MEPVRFWAAVRFTAQNGGTDALLTAAAQAGQPQPSQVLAGMFNISTLVPFFGFLALSLVLAFWYPLRKAQVEANVAALREKHGDA